VLEYEVLASGQFHDIKEFDGKFSLLSIKLITGRKHQIRAQLSYIGSPIVGDSKYFTQRAEVKEKCLNVISFLGEKLRFVPIILAFHTL